MAIPKSANERIRRKIRSKKVTPKSNDFTGRIVVKKTADNDPRRNKRKVSEEFLKFYREGIIGDCADDYIRIIENLIKVAVEAGDDIEFPFKISRLVELREMVEDDVPLVDIETRYIEQEVHVCPVCNEEITEKSTFLPESQRNVVNNPYFIHRPCGGKFRYPLVDIDGVLRGLRNA